MPIEQPTAENVLVLLCDRGTKALTLCCCDMSHRSRLFQERFAELEQQWTTSPPDVRLSIERSMLRILAMEETILRARERMEKAEQMLAHAEEIVRRLDRQD